MRVYQKKVADLSLVCFGDKKIDKNRETEWVPDSDEWTSDGYRCRAMTKTGKNKLLGDGMGETQTVGKVPEI